MIAENDVARLFATDIALFVAHRLEDIAVADGRPDQADAFLLKEPLEPEVGHHRCDH